MNSMQNRIILSHVTRRIVNNKNALILVVGETGSGKSYGAVRASEKICEIFDLDAFSIDWLEFDVCKIMEMFEKKNEQGQCIIADEIGVAMGAREWQSKANKLMSYAAQTIRYKQHIIFFTVPNLSFVDVHLRKLFHYIMRPVSINMANKTVRCSFKMLEVGRNINDKQGKLYEKYIRYKQKDKKFKIAGHLDLSLPTPENVKVYEKKKQAWSQKLYRDAIEELNPKLKINEISEREKRIKSSREVRGKSFKDISEYENLSKERVRQIYRNINGQMTNLVTSM